MDWQPQGNVSGNVSANSVAGGARRRKKVGARKPAKKAGPKIHVGPSGGKYYIRKGRKVYV